MAQFRLSVALASRSAGRSVVAMAAYRAGCRLWDERQGRVHDYARRRGVAYAGIVLPDNAPAWAADRERLWNRVEARETRGNAHLGREVQLSLPHELDAEQRRQLALEFARYVVAEYGFAVDVAIHAPSEHGDDRNHHVHLLLTSRSFDPRQASGWARTKDRRFDAIAMRRAGGRNVVEGLREAWETMQNEALERAGIVDGDGQPVRVDRRSYERQGSEIEPMEHEGPTATAIKRKGDHSDRAAENDEVRERNAERRGFIYTGGDLASPRLFRAGHSRRLAEFNGELAPPDPENRQGDGRNEFLQRWSDAPKQGEREKLLDTGLDQQTVPDEEPARRSRFHGLDELNRELSEPAEDEPRKERGGKGRQALLLNTDPRPEENQPQIMPELNRQGYGRSR